MHTLTASNATTAQPRAARRYGLILFFVVAYAWDWLFQLLSILIARQTISLPLPRDLVETIGFLSPALAALAVTAYESGGAGVRGLLAQLLRWRVRPIWYAVALGGPLLLTLAQELHQHWAINGSSCATGVRPPCAKWCLDLPRRPLNAYLLSYSCMGIAPSCCSKVSISKLNHDSTILPSAKRATLTPVSRTILPVGGMPITEPVFVALAIQRVATLSPSAI
jgi:hypothetical protein